MAIRSTFRKKEAKKKPVTKQASGRLSIGRLFLFVLLLFGLYVGVGYLISLEAFRVEIVSISGNSVILASDVNPTVEEGMLGYKFWPYRNDSIFIFPKKEIRNNLLAKFGRLDKVSFRKRGLKEIEVVVEERAGQYMWCGGVDQIGLDGQCYMLDAKGDLFDLAPRVSGDAYFKIFGGEVDLENPVGSEVFSLEDFNAVIAIKDELEKHDLDPVALVIQEEGLIEFVKKTKGASLYDGARIKFTLMTDYRNSIDNLLSAITQDPLKTEFAEKEELLQYIDVRFDNRVYYKFK
jgi:hypothetical protein